MDNSRIPATIHGIGYPVVKLRRLLVWMYDNTDAKVPETGVWEWLDK